MSSQHSFSALPIKVIRHPSTISSHEIEEDKLLVTVNHIMRLIDIKSISHFRSSSNYTYIHLIDGEPILVCKTLKKFEDRVQHHNFMRVHQSSLIKVSLISKVDVHTNTITLITGAEVPLARSKKSGLIQYLKTFSA